MDVADRERVASKAHLVRTKQLVACLEEAVETGLSSEEISTLRKVFPRPRILEFVDGAKAGEIVAWISIHDPPLRTVLDGGYVYLQSFDSSKFGDLPSIRYYAAGKADVCSSCGERH